MFFPNEAEPEIACAFLNTEVQKWMTLLFVHSFVRRFVLPWEIMIDHIYEHIWVCMIMHVWALQSLRGMLLLKWCFLEPFSRALCFSGSCSVGLKNLVRKYFCRCGCSKYLFIWGFWNCCSAKHLSVALRQLADHVEQALFQTLSAYRMVSHAVLQGRYGSCVTANGSGELCLLRYSPLKKAFQNFHSNIR